MTDNKLKFFKVEPFQTELVKNEIYNRKKMDILIQQNPNDFITEKEMTLLKRYAKNRSPLKCVQYCFGRKDSEDTHDQRIYPKGKLGLQSMTREVRAFLCEDNYIDVDICNSHPVLLYNLCKAHGLQCDQIQRVVVSREEVFTKLIEDNQDLEFDRDMAKRAVLSVINGMSLETENQDFVGSNLQSLQELKAEIDQNRITILSIYKDQGLVKKNEPILKGMSKVLFHFERKLLFEISNRLQAFKWSVDVYIHDGALVRKRDGVEIQPDLDRVVKDITELYNLEYFDIKQKPLLHPFTDITEPQEIPLITHADISNFFLQYCKEIGLSIKCYKGILFYHTKENVCWEEDEDGKYIKKLLMEDSEFHNKLRNVYGPEMYKDAVCKVKSVQFNKDIYKTIDILQNSKEQIEWDHNPCLIGFKNGVFDLQTNELRESKPEDFLTVKVKYDYNKDADYSNIQKFFYNLFEDVEIYEYFMKTLSCLIYGSQKFSSFYVWKGKGKNGKSYTTELIKACLGDLIDVSVNGNVFCEEDQNTETANPVFHQVRKCRGLITEEPKKKAKFNSSKIKKLTGGTSIKTRGLFEKPQSWKPKFDLILCCNYLPEFDDTGYAFRRRVNIFDFKFKFCDEPKGANERKCEQIDKDDVSVLQGIMNLLIKYCRDYIINCKTQTIQPVPKKVLDFTNDQIDSDDFVKQFLDENYEITEKQGDRVKATTLYYSYKERTGMKDTQAQFGRLVSQHLNKKRFNDGFFYIGIKEKGLDNDDESVLSD